MWENIMNGDYGMTGRITVKENNTAVDISTYTTRQFIFRKPSGESLTINATFDTDGINGVLKYVFQDGDIDEVGEWFMKIRLEKTGVRITSTEKNFIVK